MWNTARPARTFLPLIDPNPQSGTLLPDTSLDEPTFESAPWEQRADKIIETKINWSHGSSVELYTAENPEAARSAGLQCFHATEIFRWPTGGAKDAGETLNAMIKTVPKRGFCYIGLEGTANGAQGVGYEIAQSARWPEYDTWWKKFETAWPQNVAEVGQELQFVLIFAAWFEDWENQLDCTPEEQARIAASLDDHERELIALYQCDGPRGPRLGDEVDTTLWNQLKWRRATIEHECKRNGVDEFKQEYPSNPREAFRASGSPVFDVEGLLALDENLPLGAKPQWGNLHTPGASPAINHQPSSFPSSPAINHQPSTINYPKWQRSTERDSTICRWEPPIPGCRYIIAVDTKENSEIIKGTGKLDRNSVQVWRDGFQDARRGLRYPTLVARVKAGNQWDDAPLARVVASLAHYYGNCMIVVENNKGLALITRLRDEHRCVLYCAENWDAVRQQTHKTYGWRTDQGSRRQMVATGQEHIREQILEILCPHLIAECKSFVFDRKGKACAASGAHDDDVMAMLMALCTLHVATTYAPAPATEDDGQAPDEHRWRHSLPELFWE